MSFKDFFVVRWEKVEKRILWASYGGGKSYIPTPLQAQSNLGGSHLSHPLAAPGCIHSKKPEIFFSNFQLRKVTRKANYITFS